MKRKEEDKGSKKRQKRNVFFGGGAAVAFSDCVRDQMSHKIDRSPSKMTKGNKVRTRTHPSGRDRPGVSTSI